MVHKDNDKSDLIPEYFNDRLDAEEKAAFEKLLQEDQELMEEYNEFSELRELYQQIDPGEPAPSAPIFERISSNIEASRREEKKSQARENQLVEGIRKIWEQFRESMTVPWMLAAAQAAVIVLLLIPSPQENTYNTLSSTQVAANAEKAGINVVFRSDALESDIRSLLHSIHGSVSSGPSREGRYVVDIDSKSDLEKTVEILKQSEIVLFAEAVY